MKRALIGIVSTVIFAVSVGVESANAQAYGPYGDSGAYAAQSRSTVRRGVSRTAPLYRNPDSPAATGGGSLGYNQNLWNW
jgi:opacity protein-like surface antigen